MSLWNTLLTGGLGLVSDLFGSDSQRDANRTNIKLQREQQSWTERMSNTATQRAANDIEAAGGNRALAFTTGKEASTPVISPARVEPTFKGKSEAIGNMATAAQMQQLQAQTRLTNAQAKRQEMNNNVDAPHLEDIATLNHDLKTMAKQRGEKDYELLEQNIKNAVATGKNLELSGISTALGNERFQRMTNAVVQTALNQARAGQLDVQALENLAEVYGIEAGKSKGFVDSIVNAIKLFARGNSK